MDFSENEDRKLFRETLQRWFAANYPIERRHKASEAGFDREAWAALADLGAVGAMFSENLGGFGGDGFDIATLFTEIGRGGSVEPFLATLMAGRILGAGTEAQRGLLDGVIAGETLVALAHGEPRSRHDLSDVQATATKAGGGWALSGQKAVALHADHADHIVVSARTSGARWDEAGISLFLVPKGSAGLTVQGYPTIDGLHAAEVVLDDCTVGADALIGKEGAAFPLIEETHAIACVALAAEALGLMEVCRDATLEYLRTRTQFGRPIGTFQALQHRMATVLLEIEQARSAVINGAARFGLDRRAREMAAGEAKVLAGNVGRLVAEEAIQMHGGIGMTWEYPMTHFAKRLVMIDSQLGDVDHHTARFAALSRQVA